MKRNIYLLGLGTLTLIMVLRVWLIPPAPSETDTFRSDELVHPSPAALQHGAFPPPTSVHTSKRLAVATMTPKSPAFKLVQRLPRPEIAGKLIPGDPVPSSVSDIISSSRVDPASFGNLALLKMGDQVSFPAPEGGWIQGVVTFREFDNETNQLRIAGLLDERAGHSFSLSLKGESLVATLLLPDEQRALLVQRTGDGRMLLQEKPIQSVICHGMPREPDPDDLPDLSSQNAPMESADEPQLDSLPGAAAVLYLDFDGETVTDPDWNNGTTIIAQPAVLSGIPISEAQITEVWKMVAEDFVPFNISVTTIESRYLNAQVGRRMRCIITPTTTAAPGAGGVAYVDSFSQAGSSFSDNIPCWSFNSGSTRNMALTISHELGHTLGLRHDGRIALNGQPFEEYYGGHGSGPTGWGPLMGAPFGKQLTQWSKGEYFRANRTEDDLALIARAANGFGYMPDDVGDSLAAATTVAGNPSGILNEAGLIHNAADVDCFRFTTGGGMLTVTCSPAQTEPNLNTRLELRNSTGALLAESSPDNLLTSNISHNLPSGEYFLMVKSQGEGSPMNDPSTGFTSYGSLGVYALTGSFVPGGPPAGLPVVTTSAATNVTATSSTTGGNVTSDGGAAVNQRGVVYSTVANPSLDNGSIIIVPSGGTGTFVAAISELAPTTTYFVRAFATNIVGTAYGDQISFTTAPSIGNAVDAPSFPWTTGGNAPWRGQTIVTNDGVDAAVSGAISHSQESWMETSVTGPGSLSFWWKVSSEANFDFLEFYINGQLQSGRISGEVDWQQRSFTLGAGAQVLRWRYMKDGSVSNGADAGYVDQVVFAAHSDNADLDSLSLSSGTLSPAFASGTTSYTTSVDDAVSSITVTPTAAQANATIHVRVNGGSYSAVASSSASGAMALNLGANTVDVRVTAQDGVTQKTYSIVVTRNLLEPTLAEALDTTGMTWTTGGNAPWRGQTIVTNDGVDSAVSGAISHNQESWMETSVTGPGSLSFWWKVSSEANFDFLEFYINGQLQSGRISGEVDWQQRSFTLGAGAQVLRWRYMKDRSVSNGADAGYVDQVVFAAHSDNADLDSLSLSSGTLSPAFASGTTGFTASVENAVSSITVTPTAAQANATIHVRVNGGDYATVTSGSASGSLPLNVGANIVDVRVTAEDGVTQRIYSVGVTRDQAGATPAQLFAVAMAAAGLTDDDALPTAMPFGDGVPNLLKYAFNMNLAGADAGILAPDTGTAGLPRITSHNVGEGGGHVIRFEFLRRKGAGLVYTPKKSATLLHDSWSTLQSSPEVTPIDEQWERILYEEPYDPAVTPTVFGKLEVFLP